MSRNFCDYLASGDFVETAYTTSGQVASVTDKHGVTVYSYDGQDRIIKVSYPNGEAIDYAYDSAGNRTQVKTQHSIVDYGFDELNRLQTVTEGLNVTSYTYDKVGNRASISYANGTSIEYQYNNLNRLTKVIHKDGAGNVTQQFDYTLGLAGNRLQIAELTGRVVDYTYDKLYRLTSEVVTDATNGNRTTSFTYDKVGNRLTQVEDGITTTYSYNENDQILEEYDGSVLTSYEYDANGNTTKKTKGSEVTYYGYSQDNRLLRATTSTEVIDYTYDASGIRQSKSVNGAETHYLVDQNRDYAQVISELDELGNAQINYVYGDDLISQTQSSQEHYFMYDGLGSTRSLTNSAGVETDSYIYEAFGEIEHKNGTTPNNYLFTGEQYDPNLGFYYLRARYYNQSNGRFFSQDTYQGSPFDPKTLHKYLYTHADPINNIDPTGNFTLAGSFGQFSLNITLPTISAKTVLSTVAVGLLAAGLADNLTGPLYDLLMSKAAALPLSQARVQTEERVKRRARGKKLLFHYTTRAGAIGISACSCMIPTRYKGPTTDGRIRPTGAYATDIPPWAPITQSDLSHRFYGGNDSRVGKLGYFVAIDGKDFFPYGQPNEFVKSVVTQLQPVVGISVITIGPNLMLPR